MEQLRSNIYRFRNFELNDAERLFFKNGSAIQLAPKVFDTLLMLVRNSGRVLSKEKMLSEIWDDTFVEENNLAQNISILRKVLADTRESRFIETVPKFGYRFVVPVDEEESVEALTEVFEETTARIYVQNSELSGASAIGAPPAKLRNISPPTTQYAQNGDVNIAYQVLGSGPVDIVFVMGWVSHLEYFWKHHTFASFLEKLASFSRLILFDKRGTGLSDRVPIKDLPTLEQRMDDVRAVMDAVDSEHAVLFGVSEGGPMCALFAATYPERTTGAVMFGTYAKRIRDDDYPWAPTLEQRQAFFEKMQHEWGGPVGLEERAPSMLHDEEFRNWWAEYLRMGASPGAAVALTKMNAEIDVRNVLTHVRVPTLIMHRRNDACLDFEEGRYVASLIPGSTFVELEGEDHLPFVGDQDEIIDAIEKFVTGIGVATDYDRVLATVMKIKIVDASDEAKRRGDEDWRGLFELSRDYVARKIEIFKGRLLSYDEDGVLAVFDGPARAIRCAVAITDNASKLDVHVRTGVHTGECDVLCGTYSGFAVELAKRIAGESAEGIVLVSRTVKDLVAGSGLNFQEYGSRSFGNDEGEWRLFEVQVDT